MKTRDLRMAQGLCPICGAQKDPNRYACADCAAITAYRASIRKHKTKYKNASLDEICRKAREAGLSYGKYLARYGE